MKQKLFFITCIIAALFATEVVAQSSVPMISSSTESAPKRKLPRKGEPAAQPLSMALPANVRELAKDQKGRPIIAYFRHDLKTDSYPFESTPQPQGVYRIYLGRDAQYLYRIQDFHQDTGTPQSSQVATPAAEDLLSFDTESSLIPGVFYTYRPNGNVRTEVPIEDGVMHGAWKYYNDDGSVRSMETYRYGEMIGPFFWNRRTDTRERYEGVMGDDDYDSIIGYDKNGKKLSSAQARKRAQPELREAWYRDFLK